VPLYLLFEVSLVIAIAVERQVQRRERAAAI
jgi:Sec-independent protein secretion pathway component TatC